MSETVNPAIVAALWMTLLLGLIVTGEAVALLIGMNLPSLHASTWSTLKNNSMALIDVLTGLLLVFSFWQEAFI